jgi:hypothetical protein
MCLSPQGQIVLYGTRANVPVLTLLSMNGHLICTVNTHERINVLTTTRVGRACFLSQDSFIVSGGSDGVVRFRHAHSLEIAHVFRCDHMNDSSMVVSSANLSQDEGKLENPQLGEEQSSSVLDDQDMTSAEQCNDSTRVCAVNLTDDELASPESGLEEKHHIFAAPAALLASYPQRVGVLALDVSASQQHLAVVATTDESSSHASGLPNACAYTSSEFTC